MQPPSVSSSERALRRAVDVRRLPWMRRLAVDHAFEYERVAAFFSGNPADRAAWPPAIAAARRHARPRADITAMVRAQLDRRDPPPEASASARHLADPAAVAIVTGQQAGLFGGPLFTLLKAISTIQLAQEIARDHGIPAVPVFWIDAEDHDWDEIRGCSIFDGELTLVPIEATAPPGAGERTAGWLRWTDGIADAVDLLVQLLPASEFTPWVEDLVREAYAPGRGVSESFARLLDAVLGPHGLVVFDASDPAAKPFAADVFAREIEHPGRTALLAARAGAELVSRGYHMQVTPHADSVALFEVNGVRRPIRHQHGRFVVGDAGAIPAAELLARAREQPATLSPNVLLRPIVQDTLFPTVCYVAGPNELAYLAQLRGVYAAFGVPMPLMQQRATATLLDSAAARFLTKYDLPFEALQARNEHALNELLKKLLPPAVESALREADRGIADRMEAVIRAVPAIDSTLEGKARSVLGRMQHELSGLHAKVLQAAKRRDDTLRRQYTHVQAQAFPHGDPQERAVGGISFLNRYGPSLITRLLEALPADSGTHWVVTI